MHQHNQEKLWRKSIYSAPKLSMRQLLDIFPEANPILKRQHTTLKKKIKELEALRFKMKTDIMKYWFDIDLKDSYHKLKRLTFLVAPTRTENTFDIERIKQYPIGDLLPDPEYNCNGRTKYNCPLHNEDTPSFVWYKNTNTFYCFGCGEGGDVIELYQKLNNASFKDACNNLK